MASAGRQEGVTIDELPTHLLEVCGTIQNLATRETFGRPLLQSIVVHYPTVELHYNLPLRNHSGQFCITATLDPHGLVDSIDFMGHLYAPMNVAGAICRGISPFLYSLGFCTGSGALLPPPGYKIHYAGPSEAAFCWRLFSHNDTKQENAQRLRNAQNVLQSSIDYLQAGHAMSFEAFAQNAEIIFTIFPQAIKPVLELVGNIPKEQQEIVLMKFLQHVKDSEVTSEEMFLFLKNYFPFATDSKLQSLFHQIFKKIYTSEDFWKKTELVVASLSFLKAMYPKNKKKWFDPSPYPKFSSEICSTILRKALPPLLQIEESFKGSKNISYEDSGLLANIADFRLLFDSEWARQRISLWEGDGDLSFPTGLVENTFFNEFLKDFYEDKLAKGNADAAFQLGRIAERSLNSRSATAYYQKAVALDRTHEKALRKLEKIRLEAAKQRVEPARDPMTSSATTANESVEIMNNVGKVDAEKGPVKDSKKNQAAPISSPEEKGLSAPVQKKKKGEDELLSSSSSASGDSKEF